MKIPAKPKKADEKMAKFVIGMIEKVHSNWTASGENGGRLARDNGDKGRLKLAF